MIANVTLFTVVIFLVISFLLLDRLRFLAPYRSMIFTLHRDVIIAYALLLFLNLFGILFMIYRKFFFKDTGRKLRHLEKQLDAEDRITLTELDRTS
jgi:hypothetical protein